jgi:hypothetical protein
MRGNVLYSEINTAVVFHIEILQVLIWNYTEINFRYELYHSCYKMSTIVDKIAAIEAEVTCHGYSFSLSLLITDVDIKEF